jgi:hypothetical protein
MGREAAEVVLAWGIFPMGQWLKTVPKMSALQGGMDFCSPHRGRSRGVPRPGWEAGVGSVKRQETLGSPMMLVL